MKITVSAGNHTRENCPVFFPAAKPEFPHFVLKTEAGEIIPAQYTEKNGQGSIAFIMDGLRKGEQAQLTLCGAEAKDASCRSEKEDDCVRILLKGRPYTGYYFGTDIPKPYLGPFYEKFGSQITRLDFETKEHPHHRCVWFSHGDINGVDTWNEPKDTHGYIRNKGIDSVENGGVFTAFTAKNTWTAHDKTPLCDDTTRICFYNTAEDLRIADVELTLIAAYGDVVLGQTKEAGPVAVRVNHNLTVKNTGRFESGSGGVNEKEIWMKRAPWCDYYGTENGHLCGIAILDNPANMDYPAHWHARDYGLMAPNNFYPLGAKTIKAGESQTFKYRIVAHNGCTQEANIAARFADYTAMPEVTEIV